LYILIADTHKHNQIGEIIGSFVAGIATATIAILLIGEQLKVMIIDVISYCIDMSSVAVETTLDC